MVIAEALRRASSCTHRRGAKERKEERIVDASETMGEGEMPVEGDDDEEDDDEEDEDEDDEEEDDEEEVVASDNPLLIPPPVTSCRE